MNRRGFLNRLGWASVAVAVIPSMVLTAVDKVKALYRTYVLSDGQVVTLEIDPLYDKRPRTATESYRFVVLDMGKPIMKYDHR